MQLQITKPQTKLNNIQLEETIDVDILDRLLNSSFLKTVKYNWNGIEYENEKQMLLFIRSSVNDNKLIANYNLPKYGYGRVNPKKNLSLCCVRREVRHTLAKNYYCDIDIENCHPSLLMQICNHNNIECKYLTKYINKRDKYLKKVMNHYECDRKKAKNLFIILLYFGSFKRWLKDNDMDPETEPLDFIVNFKKELITIGNVIVKNNPDLISKFKELKKDNPTSSTVSCFLQEYERKVLEVMYDFLKANRIIDKNVVLCYDGVMIPINKYYPKLLSELSDIVKEKLLFDLVFTVKEMDEGYDVSNIEPIKYVPLFDFGGEIHTTSVSQHFKKIYSSEFIYSDKNLYHFNGVYWEIDNAPYVKLNNTIKTVYFDILLSQYQAYEKKLIEKHSDDKSKEWRVMLDKLRNKVLDLKTYKKREDYIKEILCELTMKVPFDEKPYLFAFENAIFDFSKNQFITPNPLDYISTTCGYTYSDECTDEKQKTLMKLIDSIFNDKDVRDLQMTILSTGCVGINFEKFCVNSGKGGNGKGVLNELCLSTVGNYGYKLKSSVLTEDLKTGSNPEIANVHKKRFVVCVEPDRKKQLCMSVIKELTGGKEINARLNYSNNTKTILGLTLLLECNDKLDLDEVNDATSRRLIEVHFENLFIDKNEYDKLDVDEKKNYRVGNSYYKTDDFKEDYRQALFEILRTYYANYLKNGLIIPQKCEELKQKYMQKSDYVYTWLNSIIEKDDEKKGFIKMKDLFAHFKNSDYFMSLKLTEKRKNTYNSFCDDIEKNLFFRRYFDVDGDKTKILKSYKFKDNLNED